MPQTLSDRFQIGDLRVPPLLPRLDSSHQCTALPNELLTGLRDVFVQEFPTQALNGRFLAEGWIYPAELIVRLGYLENGRLKQVNFEASVDLISSEISSVIADEIQGRRDSGSSAWSNESESGAEAEIEDDFALHRNFPGSDDDDPDARELPAGTTMDRISVCIDAIGSFVEEYFDQDEADATGLSNDWQLFEFDGEMVYLRSSNVNTELEREANRLLGLDDHALFHEPAQSEDALDKAEVDTELASEIQKAIRSGSYQGRKIPTTVDDDSDSENAL